MFIQLLVTKGACNPNLQVAITVCDMCMYFECSQHSFELPLRMSGMHRMQSCAFGGPIMCNLHVHKNLVFLDDWAFLSPISMFYKFYLIVLPWVWKGFNNNEIKNRTNRPQFSMGYTLIDHRNVVIKCSKLKWKHDPRARSFTAKFWTFYGVTVENCGRFDFSNNICF